MISSIIFKLIIGLCGTIGGAVAVEYNVLFIGNSLTLKNNMPRMFKKLANDKKIKVDVETLSFGSASWSAHVQYYGAVTKILEKSWDAVIFQEQSLFLSLPYHIYTVQSIPFINIMNEAVQALPKATTILFQTFAYKHGNPYDFYYDDDTYDKMQQRLIEGYKNVRNSLQGRVIISHVGEKWKTCVNESNLYSDLKHPNRKGSKIIATTLFETFYDIILQPSELSIHTNMPEGSPEGL